MRHQGYVPAGTTRGAYHAAPDAHGKAPCGAAVDATPVDIVWLEDHGWSACPRCADSGPAIDPDQASTIAADTLLGLP
jgi:hypothetical protein